MIAPESAALPTLQKFASYDNSTKIALKDNDNSPYFIEKNFSDSANE